MSGWLRNLQGQLTELASEVLSEATEEVDDPETELQVAKRKHVEAERELLVERGNVETLQKKVADLEERLYGKDVEVESLNIKYTGMVDSRDAQIQTLQVELERLRHSSGFGESSVGDNDDDEEFLSTGARSARLKEEIVQLKKEVQHWKRIVKDSDSADHKTRIAELERKLSDQRTKSEIEMAAIMQAHNENILHLKAEYEKKLHDVNESQQTDGGAPLLRSVASETASVNDWQTGWDEVEVECPSEQSVADRGVVQRLRDENRSLLDEREKLLKELDEVRKENERKCEQLSEQSVEVETSHKGTIESLSAECDQLRLVVEQTTETIRQKDEELSELNAQLEEAHLLVDVQREKFERESSQEAQRNRDALSETMAELEKFRTVAEARALDASRAEEVEIQMASLVETIELQKKELAECKSKFDTAQADFLSDNSSKDRDLEKLRRENSELTSAYNDLNEEFESHKAEHGSVVTSNRDLTARIDALKANLIEYEERYETCKAENAETVLQLEKLTNDFERLRLSFESAKGKTAIDAAHEVERLRQELEVSREDCEKLRTDVSRFRSAIGSIDTELNRLRESNDRLARDNLAMNASLDKFSEIQDMLEKSDTELSSLRDKFVELQSEHQLKQQEWEERLATASSEREEAQRDLEECRMRVTERESALQRYRSVVGAHAADIVEMKAGDGKGSGSEGTDSNNGWEKMADWDASAGAGPSSGAQHSGASIMEELREALAMITEKTEECEELRRQKGELEKELELRQNCADELMAQTNALQSQQQLQAEAFNQLREWANEKEHEKLETERNLVYSEEQLKQTRLSLDESIAENERLQERLREVGSSAKTEEAVVIELREDIDRVNSKYAKLKQQSESELSTLREEKSALLETIRKAKEVELNLRESIAEKDGSYSRLETQFIKTQEEVRKSELEQAEINEQNYLQKKLLEDRIKELDAERLKLIEELQSSASEVLRLRSSEKSLQERLNSLPSTDPQELQSTLSELSRLRAALEGCEKRVAELDAISSSHFEELQKARSGLADAEGVRRELIALVEQKHAESVNYHSQLQAIVIEKDQWRTEIAKYAAKITELETRLASCVESRDKTARECERLREHLLAMEESATKDGVLAEERETALRKRVRELEQKSEESADSVILSSNAFQRQIAELSDELDSLRAERGDSFERLKETERSLADTQLALSNLQRVLRDIGVDHDAQISQYDEEISDLKGDIEKLRNDVNVLRMAEKSWTAEKQQLEDTAEHLKEEVAQRDVVIEEMELQMDERSAGASSSSHTYHIDDHTLRQLFLSYFTAERDKRPEIAILLASILGYSKEDMSKIQAANESAGRGWFGLGGARRPPQSGVSIAEQFVRFLEKESVTSATSHPLPVERSSNSSTIRSSESTARSASVGPSTSDELRSILDS